MRQEIKTLYQNIIYNITGDPYNIHKDDKQIVKNRLKDEISNIIQNSHFKYQKFFIKTETRNYTIEFEKRDPDITMLTAGVIHKPASNNVKTYHRREPKG